MSSTFIIVKQLSQYLTSMREMILNTQKVCVLLLLHVCRRLVQGGRVEGCALLFYQSPQITTSC